jgi:hypothetical protein
MMSQVSKDELQEVVKVHGADADRSNNTLALNLTQGDRNPESRRMHTYAARYTLNSRSVAHPVHRT